MLRVPHGAFHGSARAYLRSSPRHDRPSKVNAMVTSNLDYCNSRLYGIPTPTFENTEDPEQCSLFYNETDGAVLQPC